MASMEIKLSNNEALHLMLHAVDESIHAVITCTYAKVAEITARAIMRQATGADVTLAKESDGTL